MTDRTGTNMWFAHVHPNSLSEDVAQISFTHWYCDNSLPGCIISNRGTLFRDNFWEVPNKLQMSTSYHPQTDAAPSTQLITCLAMHRAGSLYCV